MAAAAGDFLFFGFGCRLLLGVVHDQVAELLAYCVQRDAVEAGDAELHFPVEVVEALAHLGIYYHNFEHYRQGLVLLQLAEALIGHLDAAAAGRGRSPGGLGGGGSAAQVNRVRTHVMFYLAQVVLLY